jgi:hypothetical protein
MISEVMRNSFRLVLLRRDAHGSRGLLSVEFPLRGPYSPDNVAQHATLGVAGSPGLLQMVELAARAFSLPAAGRVSSANAVARYGPAARSAHRDAGRRQKRGQSSVLAAEKRVEVAEIGSPGSASGHVAGSTFGTSSMDDADWRCLPARGPGIEPGGHGGAAGPAWVQPQSVSGAS